ncbi:MAG: hypothetical protein IRY99_13860, partial [Isosphaeraceae bacterium]|nr:hypothetical protein [Isosphaeraceae bacterium]
MRIGIRLGGVVAWTTLAAAFALSSQGATVERVQPVPLGAPAAGTFTGERHFGVYVPTRFGGVLTIKTTSGTVEGLTGPDGLPRRNGAEVGADQPGRDQHGWYTFRVVGAERPYTVETTFVQVGQARRLPWNFYYWPTKSDAIHEPWDGTGDGIARSMAVGDDEQAVPVGMPVAPGQDIVRAGSNGILETPVAPGDTSTWFPNLYDDMTFRGADGTFYAVPSPLLKYDQLFGTNARAWEAANTQNHDIQRWPGHCLGAAIASILLAEPTPAPGSGLTRDELKALWAELGENHLNHQIGDNVNNIPPGPPRPGWDETDAFAPNFHRMLEVHIRGRRQALLANLRAFPPTGTPGEVWNHGVGKYTAKFHPVPGKGERAVLISLELVANTGSNLNNSDNKPRINTYQYTLVYDMNGNVDLTPGTSDWIAVGGEAMFCPLNVMEVVMSRWQGHNPFVNEANVRALDLANGGLGNGRFAGAPPQFRPVGAYEGGFGPLFARRGGFGGLFGFGNGAGEMAGGPSGL